MSVRCPKCKQADAVPHTDAGQSHTCSKCSVSYRIPGAHDAPAGQVRIGCPTCKSVLLLPSGSRGSTVKCNRCSATFKMPSAHAA